MFVYQRVYLDLSQNKVSPNRRIVAVSTVSILITYGNDGGTAHFQAVI